MPPKPKKAVQSAKKITSIKKAVPQPAKKVAPSIRKPTQGGKPKAVADKTRPGPMGQRNGSSSIPFAGPGPTGQGTY